MPIYVYETDDNYRVEVLQGAGDLPYSTVNDVECDQVLRETKGFSDLPGRTPIERIPVAPGLFVGLPTPKFHG